MTVCWIREKAVCVDIDEIAIFVIIIRVCKYLLLLLNGFDKIKNVVLKLKLDSKRSFKRINI